VEKRAVGENRESLHGNALLSRYPIDGVHSLALPNGKDKMKGDEKRIGSQSAVIANIHHPNGSFRAVTLSPGCAFVSASSSSPNEDSPRPSRRAIPRNFPY
jgi:hypothetical protein